ncbi:MAG: hypothetical protein HQL54_13285 [Magnetococcales bacterium]|nr:hypothetical protein [Magnetococcales bacterium]
MRATQFKNSLFKMSLAGGLLFAGNALAQNDFTLNALTLNSSDGKKLGSTSSQDKMQAFFQVQKTLVNRILSQLGIEVDALPPEVQQALAKKQTTSLQALMAFSRGLDYLDNQQFSEAKAAFDQALNFDPGFELAETVRAAVPDMQVNVVEVTEQALKTGDKATTDTLENVAESQQEETNSTSEKMVTVSDTLDSLSTNQTSTSVDLGSSSSNESTTVSHEESIGETVEEQTNSDYVVSAESETDTTDAEVATEIDDIAQQEITEELTAAFSSSPACDGGLCGLYATYVWGGQENTSGNYDSSFGQEYITEQAVELTTGSTITIASVDGENGALVGTTSPTLTNIKSAIIETVTISSEESPMELTGEILNDGGVGSPWVDVGYYSQVSSLIGDDNYYASLAFDRIFFAEGSATSSDELDSLAHFRTTYTYSGVAGAYGSFSELIDNDTMINLGFTPSADGNNYLSSSGESSEGTFSANVNFETKQVSDISLNVDLEVSSYFVTSPQTAHVAISADSATLNSNGSFNFTPSASGTSFSVTKPSIVDGSELSLDISKSESMVSGQTFGDQADAVGGVFYTRSPHSEENVPLEGKVMGYFAGEKLD